MIISSLKPLYSNSKSKPLCILTQYALNFEMLKNINILREIFHTSRNPLAISTPNYCLNRSYNVELAVTVGIPASLMHFLFLRQTKDLIEQVRPYLTGCFPSYFVALTREYLRASSGHPSVSTGDPRGVSLGGTESLLRGEVLVKVSCGHLQLAASGVHIRLLKSWRDR